VSAWKIPLSDYYAVFFNQNSNPLLKDQNIRSALMAAIDKKRLIDEVLSGNGTPADAPGFASGSVSAGNYSGFSEEAARKTITDFKAKNKNEQINLTLSVPDVNFLKKTAEFLRDSWQKIGVDQINILTFNPGDPTNSTIKSRDYEMLLFGNILENPTDLFPFWHSSQKLHPGLNLALYQNLKLDGLTESIRQTTDGTKQSELLSQAQSLILKDQPAVFLFSLPYTYIHTNELGGFSTNFMTSPADRFRNVSDWYVAQVRVIK
jgi:ABC-type transport system substrate-binding protein